VGRKNNTLETSNGKPKFYTMRATFAHYPKANTPSMANFNQAKDRIVWYINENGEFEVVRIDHPQKERLVKASMKEAFDRHMEALEQQRFFEGISEKTPVEIMERLKKRIIEAHDAGEMIVTEAQNKAIGLPKHTIAMKPWNAAYSFADIRKMIENKPKWWEFWK